MEKRYFVYFSYNGAEFCGWQIQPNGISVQEVLTRAFSTILRDEIEIIAAGRTDAGVHARLMVAHFDYNGNYLIDNEFINKLNSFLPDTICIENIIPVKTGAHARFNAVSRRYEYHVILKKNVFLNNYAMRLFHDVNFDAMNNAAEKLYEYTDFTSFSKLHTDVKTNNCVVTYAKWTQQGEEWIFTIEANRFLRNMVRAIVGTLLEVGRGKMSIEDFCNVIESKNRCYAGTSVPAKGLYLVDVAYPAEIFDGNRD